jgi:hypothetical protein
MLACSHSRSPYKTANQAKNESKRSNLRRMKRKPTTTRPTVTEAAPINSRGSSRRKACSMSAAVGPMPEDNTLSQIARRRRR